MTAATGELVKNKLQTGKSTSENSAFEINTEKFRRILCLILDEKSKENVLKVIKKLEKRDDILCAEPDYIMSICETTSDDPYYTSGEQWAINKIPNDPSKAEPARRI